MAIVYEKALKEDLELGHGTATRTSPGGGTMTGNKVGIHTLLGSVVLNAADFDTIQDAIDETGSSAALLIIPPSVAGTGYSGITTSNASLVIMDLRNGNFLICAKSDADTSIIGMFCAVR